MAKKQITKTKDDEIEELKSKFENAERDRINWLNENERLREKVNQLIEENEKLRKAPSLESAARRLSTITSQVPKLVTMLREHSQHGDAANNAILALEIEYLIERIKEANKPSTIHPFFGRM